jgi:hypothetical protein
MQITLSACLFALSKNIHRNLKRQFLCKRMIKLLYLLYTIFIELSYFHNIYVVIFEKLKRKFGLMLKDGGLVKHYYS